MCQQYQRWIREDKPYKENAFESFFYPLNIYTYYRLLHNVFQFQFQP